ncbi:MAG: hypothetical protein AAF716_21830 [Cyanobacteria bacterium P01_D01_bin.1]
MKVADLTVEALRLLIKETVTEAIEDLLNAAGVDPDAGLELRPEVASQLRDALERRQAGEGGIPLSVAANELGVDLDGL